ncbi:MAG: hypothetical protein AMS24_02060 [Chlamydiae bacterium SM23_39]|nr:MAG: hypothetical protein AMS24_02060 [Chlamydiae bacterium SM23_39]
MIFLKIWKKYILKETLLFILFFLTAIYIVYFTLDISVHSTRIFSSNVKYFDVLIYYYHNFILQLNLFLPLSFILAIIKVVYKMNKKNELLTLQMGGISKYKFSIPFFFIAYLLSMISYYNLEYLSPNSYDKIEKFKNDYVRKEKRKKTSLSTILLKDNTKIIYQKYDYSKKQLLDVFYIKSSDDIWHIKYLNTEKPYMGYFADHFKRDNSGKLKKIKSFKNYSFDLSKKVSSSFLPIEKKAISQLFLQYINKKFISNKEKAVLLTNLNFKIASPLIYFLIVLSIFPFCIKFSRSNKSFLIFAISIFSFIFFYTLMDAMIILAENNIGSPFWITWSPYILSFIIFSFKFFNKNS